jgi:hypothetical protein
LPSIIDIVQSGQFGRLRVCCTCLICRRSSNDLNEDGVGGESDVVDFGGDVDVETGADADVGAGAAGGAMSIDMADARTSAL